MYFYKEALNNIFHVGNDILPAGRYILRIYDNGLKVAIESSDTHESTMSPTEIVYLQKEDDSYYTDLAELLVATKDFFKGGYAGDVTSLEGRMTAIEDTQIKILYYEQINGTSTSGQISPPTGSTILFDQWANGEDAVVSNIVDGKPDYAATGVVVNTLDSSGNYTLSGTLATNPAAFIYWILVPLKHFDELNVDYIIDQSITFPAGGTLSNVITVAKSGGDFTDIALAIASITDNTSANRYSIEVAPGEYIIDNSLGPIALKDFTNITAIGGRAIVFKPLVTTNDMFTGGVFAYITGIVFSGNTGTAYILKHESPGVTTVNNCVLRDAANGFYLNHASAVFEISALTVNNPALTTTVNAINIQSGNADLDNITFRSTVIVTNGIIISGPNTKVSLHNLITISPTITTVLQVLDGALLLGGTASIGYVYDAMVISGDNTDVRFDALRIMFCQNNGFRVDNVGTNVKVSLFSTTITQCTGLNFNVLNPNSLVTGNGFSEINNSYVIPGAGFYVYILDVSEDDEGLNILGELHVGSPGIPAESVFGEGDSYTAGMVVYTYDGASFVDVSAAAKSASGSTFTFPNLDADSAIYIASMRADTVDVLHHYGIKTKVTLAAVFGTGNIVTEYWNGSVWVELNVMEADSGGKYYPKAKNIFQAVGSTQIRYDSVLQNDGWAKNDPITPVLGVDYYWIRYRITATITTAPVFEQWKVHSNRLEVNGDGWIEFFGTARPEAQLGLNLASGKPFEGSMQSQTLYISEDIGAGLTNNKFTATGDILGVSGFLPFDLDTSSPIKLMWSGHANSTGTYEWTVRWGWLKDGDPITYSEPGAPITNSNSIVISKAAVLDEKITFQALLDVSEMIARRDGDFGDELWLSIQPTTLPGNFSLASSQALYTKWSTGGHI